MKETMIITFFLGALYALAAGAERIADNLPDIVAAILFLMLLAGFVNREGDDELLAVLQHLHLPLRTPLLEDVLADLWRSAVDAHLYTVATVAGYGPHRHDRDTDGDGRGQCGEVRSQRYVDTARRMKVKGLSHLEG